MSNLELVDNASEALVKISVVEGLLDNIQFSDITEEQFGGICWIIGEARHLLQEGLKAENSEKELKKVA